MPVILMVASFVAMEGVSYALHRWVMHGAGMRWHASHHRPPQPGWEANDIFPACFSVIGIAVFLLASQGPRIQALWWVGIGVTAYGIAYGFVHEVYIHHRLPIRVPKWAYFEWLRRAHGEHHVRGGEPYGMLLPLLPRSERERSAPPARSVDILDRRAATRDNRSRL